MSMGTDIGCAEVTRRGFLGGTALTSAAVVAGCAVGSRAARAEEAEEAATDAAEAQADDKPRKILGVGEGGAGKDELPVMPWEIAPDPIDESQVVEVIDCDIVVVGAGISGMPAAAYAAENGANVHVVEKASRYGNKRLCTSGFNASCQLEYGIEFDRKQTILDAWKITNGVQGRMSMYGLWFDNSAPYIDWLEGVFKSRGMGLIPQPATGAKMVEDGTDGSAVDFWPGYQTMIYFVDEEGKNLVTGSTLDWMGVLEEYAKEQGATFHYNAPGEQLICDGDGNVTGVYAHLEEGGYLRLNASKGVLIATGDLTGNKEMAFHYNPSLCNAMITCIEPKNTGDGHKMACWAGAALDDFVCGDMFPFTSPLAFDEANKAGIRPSAEQAPAFAQMQYIGWRAAVSSLPVYMVDSTGRRVCTESMPFQACSLPAITATPDGKMFSIWDGAWESKFPEDYLKGDIMCINSQDQIDKEVAYGLTHKYDSIEELIEGEGFDPDVFMESFDRYNALCESGSDTDFYKPSEWMTTIDTPPFYCAMHGAGLTSTRGGIKTDEHLRVVNKKGLPMKGLYAAGNCAGAFCGNVYPPNIMGSGIGHGQCFGWLAVKEMLGIDYIR